MECIEQAANILLSMVSYPSNKWKWSKTSASKFAPFTFEVRPYGHIHLHENKIIYNVHNLKEIFFLPNFKSGSDVHPTSTS